MILAHELAKIAANQDEELPARSLSREEIEALVAKGEITPPEQIPFERCRRRESVPEFKRSTFGLILSSKRVARI